MSNIFDVDGSNLVIFNSNYFKPLNIVAQISENIATETKYRGVPCLIEP